MLIAVCIKPIRRPDVPLRLDASGAALRIDELPLVANPSDMAALEEALTLKRMLALKQTGEDPTVAVFSVQETTVGDSTRSGVESLLRTALALGADAVTRVIIAASPDSLENPLREGTALPTWRCAQAMARALGPLAPGLILAGHRSGDSGRGCFGAFLAHALGADFAHRAGRILPRESGWRVTVRLEGGYGQEMELARPAVVTIAGAPQQLPYPSLPAWIESRSASIPALRISLPDQPGQPDGGDATLRIPMPRVKACAVPESSLSAEERIGAMVGGKAGEGSRGQVEAGKPPDQLAATALAFLRAGGFLE